MKALKKIMYIEDEADIRTIANIALANLGGLEVKLCASGQEALAEFSTFKPDLILLDVMMPGMDGIETFKRLQSSPSSQSVPVVFMTARIQENEIKEYKKMGVVDVIAKPFDPLHLADIVKQIWLKCHE